MTDGDRRCNATVDGKNRCGFAGSQEQLVAHAQQSRHWLCIVCHRSLRDDEPRVCGACIHVTRDHLIEIIDGYLELPAAIENSGWRGGYGGDALVMWADGSMESAVQQAHPEDYADAEWASDPIVVIAMLESWERMWRLDFGHGPAVTVATVAGCGDYLVNWLNHAARTFDAFDDFAADIANLRAQVDRATSRSDSPVRGVRCLDCNTRLQRVYRPLTSPLPDPARSADGHRGTDREGLADTFACPSCRRDYDWADYGRAVHRMAANVEGWVPVRLAAEVVRRPIQSVWHWVRDLEVPSACRVQDRRVVVEIEQLREVSAARGRTAGSGDPTAVCA